MGDLSTLDLNDIKTMKKLAGTYYFNANINYQIDVHAIDEQELNMRPVANLYSLKKPTPRDPREGTESPFQKLPENLNDQNMHELLNEFRNFSRNKHNSDSKAQMNERDLHYQKEERQMRTRVNSLLNDFRPRNTKKKEYYNKWYVPVKHWNVEKKKEPTKRELDLLLKGKIKVFKNITFALDDLYVHKNLHNYEYKSDKSPLKEKMKKEPHQFRFGVVQEKLAQSTVAARFK